MRAVTRYKTGVIILNRQKTKEGNCDRYKILFQNCPRLVVPELTVNLLLVLTLQVHTVNSELRWGGWLSFKTSPQFNRLNWIPKKANILGGHIFKLWILFKIILWRNKNKNSSPGVHSIEVLRQKLRILQKTNFKMLTLDRPWKQLPQKLFWTGVAIADRTPCRSAIYSKCCSGFGNSKTVILGGRYFLCLVQTRLISRLNIPIYFMDLNVKKTSSPI